MSKPKGKTLTLSPKAAAAEDVNRTLKALDLKRLRHSYEVIAERHHVDAWTAREIVSIAYSRVASELADEIRVQIENRLDDLLLRRLHQDIALADTQSIRNGVYALILKVESQRASLLGLNIVPGTPDAAPIVGA